MGAWKPPVPKGAFIEARELGAGLVLLGYCYDIVQPGGLIEISLHEACPILGTSYASARRWWAQMQQLGIIERAEDRGRKGSRAYFNAQWVDWRQISSEISSPVSILNKTGSPVSILNEEMRSEISSEISSPVSVDTSGNKVLIDSDLAERETRAKKRATPPAKKPKTEKAHDPTLDHLAVITYRATFKRTPNADQRQAITMAVTDNDLWSEICALWKQNRWDYLKVENLINRYQKNGVNRNGTAHRTSSKGHPVSSAERTVSREADLDRDF